MEQQRSRKRINRCCVCKWVTAALVVIAVLALVLGLTLRGASEHQTLQRVFMDRCGAFPEADCPRIWSGFTQAFVGKDSCAVDPEAYGPLMKTAPFKPTCNRVLFWSKTKDVVHDFTKKRDCHVTLEDTLLGTVLDGLTWCGKEGSKEAFTSGCPKWSECINNPVRSFWNKASASFAEVACGDASVMLNGTIETPFDTNSIFASVEVGHFDPAVMKSLKVVLVTQKKEVSKCTNVSLKNLQKELAKGIAYSCQEVPESRIEECGSSLEIPCGGCW